MRTSERNKGSKPGNETFELAQTIIALRESERTYRTLFDSIDEGFCIIEVLFGADGEAEDYRFLQINPAFERQTGLKDAVGKKMRDLAPAHEEHWFEIYGQIALTGEPQRFERKADVLGRWYDVFAFRIGEPADRRVGILFQDIGERKRAEAALRQREADLARVQRIGNIGGFDIDLSNGCRGYRSPEYRRLHGIPDSTLFETHDQWMQRIHPDDRQSADRAFHRAVDGAGAHYRTEYRIVRPDNGEVRWISAIGDVERDMNGKAVRLVGAHIDVTDRKRSEQAISASEQRTRLLLAELQHRVRNTLSVVRSIARRTAETSNSVEDYMMRLDGRLDVFSRTQALVTRDPTAGIHFEYLVAEELRAYGSPDSRQVRISGPHLRLQAKTAETMALVIHELATNALKYGSLSTSEGKLTISWRIEDRQVVLEWTEKHGPPPKEKITEGFGAELLTRILRYELDAKTDMRFPSTGFQCRIELPLQERLFKTPLESLDRHGRA
jgi:PAS domain S-box-containing protein